MNAELNNWLQAIFRWAHLVAGILWIGHLYFFNFVNGLVAKALDGGTKKVLVPELMPRALYWFRWGAIWTWTTGILLAGMVYYMGGVLFEEQGDKNEMVWFGIVLGLLVVGFLIYNTVMNVVKNVMVANIINLAVLAGVYYFLAEVGEFSGRALYIHIGAILGTVMLLNVWMVIWPAQKKIIAATRDATAPDAALVAKAGLRSRQNTLMSVPLMFFMISNHYATIYGSAYRDIYAALILAIGFIVTILLYRNSARRAAAKF